MKRPASGTICFFFFSLRKEKVFAYNYKNSYSYFSGVYCQIQWYPSYFSSNHNLEASLVSQMVKNPPAMQNTQVQSLGQEDPLEKGMATHSSILAWRIPWTEEPGGLQQIDCEESDETEWPY